MLDGAIRIPDLMKHCKKLGMSSVAMTDHGNMFGAIEFYKAAVKEGVKPIIGNEVYVAPGDRRETKVLEKLADGNNYHLILLATNKKGYENLIKLTSRSYTEGFYRKPRIDYDLLASHSEGLVCTTACLGGEVQRKIMSERSEEAFQLAGKLQDIFGKDRFYLEIQNHGLPEEDQVAKGNLEIHRRTGIPMVLTNDSHFLTRDDHAAQDILLRINSKKNIDEELLFGFTPDFYVKSPAEMAMLFPELPDAFHNTMRIAEMVDLDFEFGNPLLPKFEVPEHHTLDTYLRELTINGLNRRYNNNLTPQIMERFEFEYGVITTMDFSGYFLIVQDFIMWAKNRGIPVGPGRGSAAGSIIAYALGITDIDPLRYDLLFERFLNPDRNEMPDIDIDFCTEGREEVINYAREKYGSERVGMIVTYGTMAAKACLKDVARVLNIPFDEANQISKKFPDVLNISLDDALKTSKELREYSEKGDVQRKLFAVAGALEGNARQTGIHAAGVVIAPEPLEQVVPLATVNPRTGGSNERVIVTQYDKVALEDVGLVKMDFLGLRNLTVINKAVQNVKERLGVELDLNQLTLDDPQAYALLQKGDVKGVFQLESSPGMREFVLRMKPTRFEEIIALIALFRPGPLQSGMADSYINRKNGKEKVTYQHPDLAEVLDDTFGVIVYQEQVMLVSRKIGGFTPGESDALRKAMGKKIHEKMAQMRVKFVDGAVKQGYEQKFAEDIYDKMAEFASYGFNKSHSAAYAMIVYQTAYLKANYPTDYMCAVLDSELDKTEKLVPYLNAVRAMGMEILGPDINESRANFTAISDGVIRFGLGGIKNVGGPAVESILTGRNSLDARKFASFFEVLENVDLKLCNRRTLESMVHAGVFSSLGYTRKALIEGMEMAIQHGQRSQADRASGQTSLFGALEAGPADVEPIPRGEGVSEYGEQDILKSEKEVLGFYFSGHPLERYERMLRSIKSVAIENLGGVRGGSKVEIAGVISEFSVRLTKTQREMARMVLEDMTGHLQCTVFPASFERVRADLAPDKPVLLRGTLEKNEETGTPQLLVDAVQPLNEEVLEEKMEKSLHLKLNSGSLDNGLVQQLQTILRGYSGPLQVYFHLVPDALLTLGGDPNRDPQEHYRVIRAHESFSVTLNKEMINRLEQLDPIKGVYLSVGDQYRALA